MSSPFTFIKYNLLSAIVFALPPTVSASASSHFHPQPPAYHGPMSGFSTN